MGSLMKMGTTLSVVSELTSIYSQNQALIEQGKMNQQTARNYLTAMNYSFQNLEQSRLDAFEAAVSELEKTKLQGKRMESQVAAAVNEGLEGGGRTADLLKRAAEADTNRATLSIKDNYRKRSNEIDLNKEAALLNARQSIQSIQDVQKPSLFGTILGIASAYYQGRIADEKISTMRNHAGVGKEGNTVGTAAVPKYSYDTSGWSQMFNISNYSRFNFYYQNPYDNPRSSLFG